MDHFESQSSSKTFSNKTKQKSNSQNEEHDKVSSLSDTNETDRRFPRPDEMDDNTDFCANDDLENIFVASSNLAPDPSSILLQQENFTRHRHLSFPFSVLRYTSKTPSKLSSISQSVGHFSEIHWKKAKLRDYNETSASSLVEHNEVEGAICVVVTSNEEYGEATDVKNPEKTCKETSDFDEECSVDDPPALPGTSISQLNTTSNPLNKWQSNGSAERSSVVHADMKKFISNVCDKDFKRKAHLKSHMFIHEEVKPLEYDLCGKMFAENYRLRRHVQGHKGEKPFSCDTCGMAFTQKGHLNRHLLVHKGEKPFVCDICGKSCRQKSDLKRHALIHTYEKRFSCEVCGKRLKSKNGLNYHMETIHHK